MDDDDVVWLAGDLDIARTEAFICAASKVMDGQRSLTLDLSALSFLDSSGIRAILALAERAQGRGITLRRPNVRVRKVLDLTGIVGRAGISLDES